MRGARASDANERCADSRDFARFYGSDDEQPSVRVHRRETKERQKKKKNERKWVKYHTVAHRYLLFLF